MSHNIDPSDLVNIPCPSCGQKTAVSVATIESSPRLRCDACGATYAINAQKVMDKIRAAQEQAELERRRRGV
jgi:transcription elongation factor Elf1